MAITSETARADIFKEFYSVIKTNLTTSPVKVTNAFVDDIAELPQVVIHAPRLPKQRNSFGITTPAYDRSGQFDIEVYAVKMQSLVELVDDLQAAIYDNLGDLSVQNINLGDSSEATISVGGKDVHVMVIPVAFKFVR